MATTSEKSAILLHTNTAGMRKNATCLPLLATQVMRAACRQNNSAKGTGVNDKGWRDSEKCRDAEKRIRRDERKARTELGRRVYPWPHGGTRDLFSWALHPIIGLSPSDSIYFTCDLLPAIALAQVAKVVLHTIVLFGTFAIVEAI